MQSPDVERMSDFTLRQAATADAARIVSILHAAFEEYRGWMNPPSGVLKESVESVLQKMQTARWVLAETVRERRAVGCVLYEPRDEFMYLGRLAVLPEFRRRGVGDMLIESVEAEARRQNYTRVRLGVRASLPKMRAAYERRGYRFVEAHTHEGFSEPTYVMLEKDLVPQTGAK